MTTTIGRVDFIVGLDGTTLPTEARLLGERIGQALAAAAARRANYDMSRAIGNDSAFDDAGKQLGIRLASALSRSFEDRLGPSMSNTSRIFQRALPMGDMLEDIGELRVVGREASESMDDLGESVDRNNSKWARFRSTLSGVSDRLRNMGSNFRNSARENNDFASGLIRTTSHLKNILSFDGGKFVSMLGSMNDGWKEMTHGVRQAIFYTVLFATLATQIAVLGSAAGVALTVLAGALVSTGLAVGALVLLFSGLSGELSELDPAIQPAVAAFRAIGDAFGEMQDAVQKSVLPSLIPAFEQIRSLVETLTPGMVLLAGAVGGVISQLSGMLSSANGLEVLNGLIAGAATIFPLLASAAFNLGGALGNIFLIAQPYIIEFAGWLNDLFTRFNEWTQSLAGNTAIQEWLSNGFTVLSAIGDLAAQAGQFLAQLVTPETIALFITFMQIIGAALQPIGDFLIALNEFQIFNLIAQLLLTVFAALQPLMPAFALLGQLISGVLLVALQALTPLLTLLVSAFAALIEPLLGALMPLLPVLAGLLMTIVTAFTPLLEAVVMLATTIGAALVPVIVALVGFISTLITALMPLYEAIIPPLIEIITVLADTVGAILNAVLPILIQLLDEILAAILPIIPVVVDLITEFLSLISPLLELLGPILPPLIAILKLLVTVGITVLTAALRFLAPVIMGVANAFGDVLIPIIDIVKGVIEALIAFLTGVFTGQWEGVWNRISSSFKGIWNGILSFLKGVVNAMVSVINGIIGGINAVTGAVGIPKIPSIPRLARGGIAWQSTLANIGEAGPEMIVPLRRPLGQIDPRVRDVAAYAQGKTTGTGGGNTNNVDITVIDNTGDSRRTAVEVVDRFVEVAG